MSDQVPFGALSFAENPEPRCPCVLLLDTSGSMGGAPIRALNEALLQYREELLVDGLAAKRVEVAVVSFGGQVQVLSDFTTADAFSPPILSPSGETPMGHAILRAVEMIQERKAVYRQSGVMFYRPWIFLITDGAPTDAWEEAAARVKQGEQDKSFSFFCVGVEGASVEVLRRLSVREPLKLNGLRFRGALHLAVQLAARGVPLAGGRRGEAAQPRDAGWVGLRLSPSASTWRFLAESVAGTAHRRAGVPCQDSSHGLATCLGGEAWLVLACADGAGSAEWSHDGAALACRAFVEGALQALAAAPGDTLLDGEALLGLYRGVRAALRSLAERRGLPARELACTLLTAVLGEHSAWFAQVGDGAIVVREGERFAVPFWPQSGEYVNTTHFVTDPDFESAFQCWRTARVDEAALLTDGLQLIALEYAARAAHRGFFEPMLRALREAPAPEELITGMRLFLESPAVNARTDDDKTLILAVRVDAEPL